MSIHKPEWRIIVDLLEKVDPILLNRITRRMIYYLHTKEVSEIITLVQGLEPTHDQGETSDQLFPNVPHPKKDPAALKIFVEEVFKIAGKTLPHSEISSQIKVWMLQERSRFLSITAGKPNVPLVEIEDALNQFFNISSEETHVSPDEFYNIRVSLIRRFLSDHLPYIIPAKEYITVRNFSELIKNVIGPSQSAGKLGGKSAGLILGHEIIKSLQKEHTVLQSVRIPRSWYITSDTTMDFIHYNTLEELTSSKYRDIDDVRAAYPFLKLLFKNSFFTSEIIQQLNSMLEEIGEKPIIVRSSSLLEDSFGASFSGKYKSLFLSNQGPQSERLSNLLNAISEIYASVFGPDPIQYRKERGLLDFNEAMGILIQEVVGQRVGDYFFPLFGGVAFSKNEFRWSPRIEREDGAVRLAFGLGTHAVDRIGNDYCFLASPGKPGLRVNVEPSEVARYSQKGLDVLNLKTNAFTTLPVQQLLSEFSDQIPNLANVISIHRDGMLKPLTSLMTDYDPRDLVVSFQGLTENTSFLNQIDTILKVIEKATGWPIDVEFASDGNNLYFLQCRPQGLSRTSEVPVFPQNVEPNKVLFSSDRFVTTGVIRNISYIVFVVPEAYEALPDASSMKRVAKAISYLNRVLERRSFILVGPGRWGSRGDIKLGVPVTYSDINNTAMLIEVACRKGDYIPELSFGTHFFQDLVEANILYLPIYLESGSCALKSEMLTNSRNSFSQMATDFASLSDVIIVAKTSDIVPGGSLSVVMDSETNKALGFIE